MNGVYFVVILLFALIHVGFSLECYHCGSLSGTDYSPVQCEDLQTIKSCGISEGNFRCANLTISTITNNVTKIEQAKSCLLEDDCKALNKTCHEVRENGAECSFSCCQEDYCNDDVDPDTLVKCYQCDGPFANWSLAVDQSSSLQSYDLSQCLVHQKKVARPNGTCGALYRRFNRANVTVEVSLRSCLLRSECKKAQDLCEDIGRTTNNTEICSAFCCDSPDFCNEASQVNFIPASFFTGALTFLLLAVV